MSQNGETLLKLKSFANIPGCNNAGPPADVFLTGSVNLSTWLNSSSRLWLNRKLRTGLLTSPLSTRKVPSRVIPVSVFVRGSTSRIYHNRVISNPLSSSPTSSSVVFDSPFPRITRLTGDSPNGFGRGSSCPVGGASLYLGAEILLEASDCNTP